jgi:hypothetical protein
MQKRTRSRTPNVKKYYMVSPTTHAHTHARRAIACPGHRGNDRGHTLSSSALSFAVLPERTTAWRACMHPQIIIVSIIIVVVFFFFFFITLHRQFTVISGPPAAWG